MTAFDPGRLDIESMLEEHVTTINHIDLLMQAIRAPRTTLDVAVPKYRELLDSLLRDLEEIVVDHFRFEETHLFPLLRQSGKTALADALELEHSAIQAATQPVVACLHAALAANPSEKQWVEFGRLATDLAGMHRTHMRREESEMVPVLRALPAG